MVSTSDYHTQNQGFDSSTYDSGFAGAPRRQDPNQLLMLPAPLSVNRMTPTSASTSTAALSRSSEEGGYNSDIGSHQRLISPQEGYTYGEDYDASPPPASQYAQQLPFDARVSRTAVSNNAVYRQSSANQYTVETQHGYAYSPPQAAGYDDQQQFPYTTEPEEVSSAAAARSRSRGVSLVDNGPVQTSQGVRRVSRQPRRASTQAPTQNQNRYSRGNSMPMPQQYGNLPPGAAPPQSGYGY